MKLIISSIFFWIGIYGSMSATNNKALVICPVADLVAAPIKTFKIASTNKESYQKIGLSAGPHQPSVAAPRVHQLLFNEIVEIIKIQKTKDKDENEVCIKVYNAFFMNQESKKVQTTYWTQYKNLLPLEELERKKVNLHYIPNPPFSTLDKKSGFPSLVLIKPFFDTQTQTKYSVGTRFVYEVTPSNEYYIYIYDAKSGKFKKSLLPREYAHINNQNRNQKEFFLQILKGWANLSDKIAYVLGGCSYTQSPPDVEFNETLTTLIDGTKIGMYERPNFTTPPLTGFDCTGILLRAAQIAGIPYFLKNTSTILHYLTPLPHNQTPQEGDLIWIPGHVMVISSIKNNTLIEAAGYQYGYGVVHEIKLKKVFKQIETFEQLQQYILQNLPLIRLNKLGQEVEKIQNAKLLTFNFH